MQINVNGNDLPSLVVVIKVEADKLARIVSQPPKTAIYGNGNDDSNFAPRFDIMRDLSPIRGAIHTPATSLANAPVLTEKPKSRAGVTQGNRDPFAPLNQVVPVERRHPDLETSIQDGKQALHPEQQRKRMSTRCEGCHTREAVNIGYWILDTPKPNSTRTDDVLNHICVHKLRRANTMADAMLQNAQRDLAKLTAEYANLQAQCFPHVQSAGPQTTLHDTSELQSLSGSYAPPLRRLSAPLNEQGMLNLASQGIRQSPHDIQARAMHAQAFQFFIQRVPGFPEHELRGVLQQVFNAGRTYAGNTQVAAAFRDGVSEGHKVGISEGWDACDQYGDAGSHEDFSESALRGMISRTCGTRDTIVREIERLEKLIDMVRPAAQIGA